MTDQHQGATSRQETSEPDDISAGEYVADDDRARPYGYCAVPRHASAPAPRARAERLRRRGPAAPEDDGG